MYPSMSFCVYKNCIDADSYAKFNKNDNNYGLDEWMQESNQKADPKLTTWFAVYYDEDVDTPTVF